MVRTDSSIDDIIQTMDMINRSGFGSTQAATMNNAAGRRYFKTPQKKG